MSDANFIRAIIDRPGDGTPRLAFAEWLADYASGFPDPAGRDRTPAAGTGCSFDG